MLKDKLFQIFRLDRSLRFVWQAGAGWVTTSVLLLVLQGLVPLAALYLIKLIIDATTTAMAAPDPWTAWQGVAVYIVLAGCVALLQTLLQAAAGLVREGLSLTVSDRMYDVLHDRSLSLDLAYYENPAYFDTLHRAQREGPYRPTHIVNNLTGLAQNAISLVFMAGLLLTFHWAVALVLFLTAVPGVLARLKYARKMFDWQREHTAQERLALYYNFILTGHVHAKEVRLFGVGPEIADRFARVRKDLRLGKLTISRRRAIADVLAQAFGVLAVFGVLGVITYRAVLGAITLGDMVMFYQAFQRGLGYLRQMLQEMAGLYENNLFMSFFYDLLSIAPAINDPDRPLPPPDTNQAGFAVDNVRFSYPGTDTPVLKNISFAVTPGEVVALVGANGSGKTTLVKLLCRLYDPDQGRVTVENIPLDHFAVADVRKMISVIFQDFAQYHLTAHDNIRFGDIALPPSATAAVQAAAKSAGADNFISHLPKQYQTILGKMFQDGVDLSIGQWQMVALARAFLRDARLIILDEPTSSLDPDTEHTVFKRFRRLLDNKSTIIISHRFSTVRLADRILVLKDGRIVEQGDHAALMQANGHYADMFTKQSESYLPATPDINRT